MSNSLRIIYNNLIDDPTTTIAVSSSAAGTPASNLQSDLKGLVWRSSTHTTTVSAANITLTFTAMSVVQGVILAFSNLTSSGVIRTRGFSGAAPTLGGTVNAPTITPNSTTLFDTGYLAANPVAQLGQFNFGITPLGTNAYENRRGYARVWLPSDTPSCMSMVLEIQDTTSAANTEKFIEVSRVIVGNYWSPRYNTSYGLSMGLKDLSTSERSEAGDLITSNGAQFGNLSFDLKYMDPADRTDFNKIMKSKGIRKPLFVSLFPDNADDYGKEQLYQIYGKLTQPGPISHPMFDMYETSVEIEEV